MPSPDAAERAGYAIAHRGELERNGDWSLVRRSLDIRSVGVNLVEIQPGGSIPEHDESDRDQEELFFVVSGSAALVIDGDERAAPAGTFARLDPSHRRTVRNHGDEPASVLIVSAPRTSGYVPMEWA
jgi:quercetin dioxygenase-like cupin family protein